MIHALKPYPKMKDSGVQWLGEVPEHWEVRRLTSCIRELQSGAREQSEVNLSDGIPNLGGEHIGFEGQILKKNMRYVSLKYFEGHKKGIIKNGDILLVKDGATIGKTAYLQRLPYEKCGINEHLFIIRSSDDCLSCFLFQNLRSAGVQEGIWQQVKGSAQPGLNSSFTKHLFICLPPLHEQASIVHYLDHWDRKIRHYIHIKQKLIKLLQEQRQIIIHRVVTQGLNPKVPIKPSGVAWLGEVPAHWDIRRGKTIFFESHLPATESDEIVTCFRDGQVTLRRNRRTRGFMIALKETGYQGVRCGQLVIHAMDAFAGAIGVSDSNGKCSPEYIVCNPRFEGTMPEYYSWCLRIAAKSKFIEVCCPAVRERAPRLRYPNFGQMLLPIPPPVEQRMIVQFINEATTDLRKTISRAEREISLLREYRTRLISDVVTGKLDVREAASHLPDESEMPEEAEEPEMALEGDDEETSIGNNEEMESCA